MKLYYSPGACSIGIHVLLEEIGQPFETEKVDLASRQQFESAYTSINPKSKVPVLIRDDGTVLTEFPAIAAWLALSAPDKRLLPADADGKARALETIDYVVATIHMQGFSRMFRPGNFAPTEADHTAVKARGREIIDKGMAELDKALAGKDYALGDFSIADVALFYVEFWGNDRMKIPLPPNCVAHLDRMKERPAVQRVLQKEGFA